VKKRLLCKNDFHNRLQHYPKKKLCSIWDNAKFHKGKEIHKELRIGGKLENVYFINLPPYAPEHNPIEHVWNTAKSEVFKLRISEGFEELKRKFASFISVSNFNYRI
jgi:transposase